jgi:molybdate transport system ATP-binding protein
MTGIADNMPDNLEARFLVDYGCFALDVDLALPGRGVTAVFGHSGSGKTTLLRCLAGLTLPTEGRLRVNGDVWLIPQTVSAWTRTRGPCGMSFRKRVCFPI